MDHSHKSNTGPRLDSEGNSLQNLHFLPTRVREVHILKPNCSISVGRDRLPDSERDSGRSIQQPEYS